ncbi:MAG: DUF58 domain-containing protein [Candidatus Cloacimonetes bacterium]|nr:DUF58 domain-containing protein [Candidatus Cloacimonadota bacterium]MCF7813573.1 DUF58 domain-containing protein [Candidatus Cloacimonadota bacterium]MCF7868204.1 DUF58 domain-containing protein [Candidatus Cloacimonadota bacterium]MCF7883632.1 DUF58 domain-containing protein [Candidatus Cloacimonadota bacterium]
METSDIIKRIKKIEITTRNLVNDLFSGEYHSLFKGQGLEFSEVREYQEGDSFRQIDWNVTARQGFPFIKKFEETRELNVLFLVDGSASTLFGTHSYLKSELITEITAVLSFSALSNNDKVGLLLFTDDVEKYVPPRKGKKSALRILRDILYFEPKNKQTNITKAVEYIYRLTKKKSIIFVISDFMDDDYTNSLKLLAKKHDVIALRVLDKAEIELPDAGILQLKDAESGKMITVNSSHKKIRDRYSDLIKEQDEKLKETFRKMKIELVTLFTDKPYAPELRKFFKFRIRMKNQR